MSASSHDHPEPGPPRLAEVADGVFAYIQPDGSWYINNTGFVVGRSSVISVDACSTERRTRAYLARQTDLGDYDGWLDRERIVGNLHRAYADLGAAGGVNVIGALTDMVAFNGGTPLSCYA